MLIFKSVRHGLTAAALALLAAFPAMPAAAQTSPAWDKVPLAIGQTKPDLVLTGTVARKDFQHNLAVPFDVPKDVQRIGIDLQYTRPDGRTVINLGLFDGEHFRGWSGSNKHAVVIDENNATPSFIPGPVGGRRWALDLGISWISEGVTSQYTANIYFFRYGQKPAVSTFSPEPLETGARWYRGDFHMHTGESDGFCASRKGRHIPCPVFRTVLAAEDAHLDFIGMTDHNNVGHYNAMRELQPYFDDVLLIPGREMTTEQGHANIFGTTQYVDYRMGEPAVPDMKTMLRNAVEAGAIVSINHPGSPSDARCRGCGWTAPDDATAYVSAMEAMNAGNLRRQMMGGDAGKDIPRWEEELAKGRRITLLGGSDNHDVQLGRLGVGFPTTLVYAADLSERSILDAVKAGHVAVDMTGALGHGLDLKAQSGTQTGMIGDNFTVPAGRALTLGLHVTGSKGNSLVGFVDGKPDPALSVEKIDGDASDIGLSWKGDGARHWIRFEVRKEAERLMMTNPVYVNFGK
ncbi:CehA/McbA family metallohydrolase [Sphingobium aquiterrae]|uniref:CehA/McbA family metallohydrolase n=1 Tax=Sphingobium aquiterrae TaxID=2038656 RepID=UPI0030167BF2